MIKKLMLGNEAIAAGLYEAGVTVVSSYPGTPSTEITEYASKYPEIYCEWAPNEKVAAEVAIGACYGGGRAFSAMKHVGLNVAADPLYTASYTGVNGGLVIAVADDPGMHSSQNEQDSRNHAKGSKLPMIEPADSKECRDYIKIAFELSEKYDTPVLLRLTTRIAHTRTPVVPGERVVPALKDFKKDPAKYVMMPTMARLRHPIVEKRMRDLEEYSETASINKTEMHSKKIGVICAGICYQYAKEALGESASYLKLGMINPLPVKLIKDFAAKCDKIIVLEELDGFIETHCKAIGLDVVGKNLFGLIGEFSQTTITEKLLSQTIDIVKTDITVPVRPPVMCAGCPHRGIFYIFNKLKLIVSGDIGCYTLGAVPPLNAMDTCVDMGAAIPVLHGMEKAAGRDFTKKSIAVIGDSTFIHSGVTGLINNSYNKGISTVMILDNSTTGMTGHQENPSTGYTITGDPTTKVDLEALSRAVGINRVTVIDPYDLEACEKVIKEEIEADEASVIIARRPCALLKTFTPKQSLKVEVEKCTGCKLCMKIGCPSISFADKKAKINPALCVGCDVCIQMCRFNAIS